METFQRPTFLRDKLLLQLALVLISSSVQLVAQTTAFTYQGRLLLNGVPASGSYDLRTAIYDASVNGGLLGSPLTNGTMAVSNGLFTVTLDFGAGVFTGASRWLDLAVRTNGSGAFVSLTPRQALAPSPYALYAPNAGSAAAAQYASSAQTAFNAQGMTNLNASQITSGTISDALLSSNVAMIAEVPSGNSLNLERMGRIDSLLQTRDTSTNPVTLVAFGDSVSEYDRSPQRILFRTMACSYGLQEASRDDDIFRLAWSLPVMAGGAAYISGPDVNWISDYWQIPAGGSAVVTNFFDYANGLVWARGFEVIYMANPAGGSFSVQLDSGAGYSTVATINANAATPVVRSTNIVLSVGGLIHGRLKFLGQSGTNNVMMCLPMLSVAPSQDKLRVIYSGKGGIGLDQFLAVNSNALWSTVEPMLFHSGSKSVSSSAVSFIFLASPSTNASLNHFLACHGQRRPRSRGRPVWRPAGLVVGWGNS